MSRSILAEREILTKVLADLSRLPPKARRLDIEAAIWRSVARHARNLSADQVAEATWEILRRLADDLARVYVETAATPAAAGRLMQEYLNPKE